VPLFILCFQALPLCPPARSITEGIPHIIDIWNGCWRLSCLFVAEGQSMPPDRPYGQGSVGSRALMKWITNEINIVDELGLIRRAAPAPRGNYPTSAASSITMTLWTDSCGRRAAIATIFHDKQLPNSFCEECSDGSAHWDFWISAHVVVLGTFRLSRRNVSAFTAASATAPYHALDLFQMIITSQKIQVFVEQKTAKDFWISLLVVIASLRKKNWSLCSN
jgi:hypothetical protein